MRGGWGGCYCVRHVHAPSSLPPFLFLHTSLHVPQPTTHAIQVVRRGLERVTAAAVLQRNDALLTLEAEVLYTWGWG